MAMATVATVAPWRHTVATPLVTAMDTPMLPHTAPHMRPRRTLATATATHTALPTPVDTAMAMAMATHMPPPPMAMDTPTAAAMAMAMAMATTKQVVVTVAQWQIGTSSFELQSLCV